MARTELPTSVEELREMVIQKQTTIEANATLIDEQAALITFYREWKRLVDSQRFGAKSEKFTAAPDQGLLFNEAELEASKAEDGGTGKAEPADNEVTVPGHTRKKGGRRPLTDFLPVQEVLHDLPEEDKICAHNPTHVLVEISRETSDQLKFILATLEIVRNFSQRCFVDAIGESYVDRAPNSWPTRMDNGAIGPL